MHDILTIPLVTISISTIILILSRIIYLQRKFSGRMPINVGFLDGKLPHGPAPVKIVLLAIVESNHGLKCALIKDHKMRQILTIFTYYS